MLKPGQSGKKVILCRLETSPEDLRGMAVAQGFFLASGGMTSMLPSCKGMGKMLCHWCWLYVIDIKIVL
jgi:hypothetical protein